MTPTDVLSRPASDFWLDAKIRAAGVAWENDAREQARSDANSAGSATQREKQDMVENTESRADVREQRDGQPALQEQLDGLENVADPSAPGDGDTGGA